MDTKKKMSIGLVMTAIVVAAMSAPMAFAGEWVPYHVEVATEQNTYMCCGPDGDFGRMFVGATKGIIGTFGLRNIGGTNALVDARFLDSFSGVFGLVDDPATPGAVIPATNFRLRPPGNESTKESFECGLIVASGDWDIGTGLIGFAGTETHAENKFANTAYDCGEWIYKDVAGNSLAVEINDIRLTDVQTTSKFYSCGSAVASGDEDLADAGTLIPFNADETYADDGSTAYDCGEWIYKDVGGPGVDPTSVQIGDTRLTFVQAMCDCVSSTDCPAGSFVALQDNGDDIQLNGYVPARGPCCCYNAKLTVPGGTPENFYYGFVQLTFSNAP